MISLQSFPSPVKDYAKENPQWTDDINRLTSAVRECLPEAVRRVVRDNWEKCLLGSEFHQAFIVSASFVFPLIFAYPFWVTLHSVILATSPSWTASSAHG